MIYLTKYVTAEAANFAHKMCTCKTQILKNEWSLIFNIHKELVQEQLTQDLNGDNIDEIINKCQKKSENLWRETETELKPRKGNPYKRQKSIKRSEK